MKLQKLQTVSTSHAWITMEHRLKRESAVPIFRICFVWGSRDECAALVIVLMECSARFPSFPSDSDHLEDPAPWHSFFFAALSKRCDVVFVLPPHIPCTTQGCTSTHTFLAEPGRPDTRTSSLMHHQHSHHHRFNLHFLHIHRSQHIYYKLASTTTPPHLHNNPF